VAADERGISHKSRSLGATSCAPPDAVRIPRSQRVFVNRDLRMSSIEWIGFDMDYTLAIYDPEQVDRLSIRLTVERLLEAGYPGYLGQLAYDTRFPIRGLLIDKRHGHVLKMNRHKVVYRGYHGFRRLQRNQLLELYHHKRIRPHTTRYHWIDTLFSLGEATTYAAIVDALEARGGRVDYAQLFADVRSAADAAHHDGAVHASVLADPPRFIHRDPMLARTLHKLRSAGKRLFLLTNSAWPYTNEVMAYLLEGALPEYPSWKRYFDVVITSAQKPGWFQDGQLLRECDGAAPRGLGGAPERGRFYEGGNLLDFERRFGLQGSSVLYVGDHIYGDILRSKKESSWRTAMIIQELDAEIAAHESCAAQIQRQRELEDLRNQLEDELRLLQAAHKAQPRASRAPPVRTEKERLRRSIETVRGELRKLDAEHSGLGERIDQVFHPYWGSLLKEQGEMSSFGLQVATYADIYTRSVSCLLAYSPQQFFRSPHDQMPHER